MSQQLSCCFIQITVCCCRFFCQASEPSQGLQGWALWRVVCSQNLQCCNAVGLCDCFLSVVLHHPISIIPQLLIIGPWVLPSQAYLWFSGFPKAESRWAKPSSIRSLFFGPSSQSGFRRQTQCQCSNPNLKTFLFLLRLIIKVGTGMQSVMQLRLLEGLLWCTVHLSLFFCFLYPYLSIQLCHIIFLPEPCLVFSLLDTVLLLEVADLVETTTKRDRPQKKVDQDRSPHEGIWRCTWAYGLIFHEEKYT